MRVFMLLSCAAMILAQPAKVREETPVRSSAGGDVIGKLSLGADAMVVSRVTTETGSWCRVTGPVAGSVPCKALLISAPPSPSPSPSPPSSAARSGGVSRVAAKPAVTPAVTAAADLGVIEHPTTAQIRRAFPGHGEPRTTQPTTPESSLLQQYKFPGDNEIFLTLWVRPAGTSAPAGDADVAKKAMAADAARLRPHIFPGGRRARWSAYKGDFTVTGRSPDGEFEWTMVYTTTEDPQDVTSYVLTGAAALDRILFGTR